MIITDKDGKLYSIDTKIIIRQYTQQMSDNCYRLVLEDITYKEFAYHFATKEEAESVLKQIDARMEALCNHWNPAHNVPPLTKPLSEILTAVSEPRELNID